MSLKLMKISITAGLDKGDLSQIPLSRGKAWQCQPVFEEHMNCSSRVVELSPGTAAHFSFM